jgi:hypothetical protein
VGGGYWGGNCGNQDYQPLQNGAVLGCSSWEWHVLIVSHLVSPHVVYSLLVSRVGRHFVLYRILYLPQFFMSRWLGKAAEGDSDFI